MEFESEEDWKYYLDEDPAHVEFKGVLKDVVEKVGCFDFQAGGFCRIRTVKHASFRFAC